MRPLAVAAAEACARAPPALLPLSPEARSALDDAVSCAADYSTVHASAAAARRAAAASLGGASAAVLALAFDAGAVAAGAAPADMSLLCARAQLQLVRAAPSAGPAAAAEALQLTRSLFCPPAQHPAAAAEALAAGPAHPLPWLLWALAAAAAVPRAGSAPAAGAHALRSEALSALTRALGSDPVAGQRPLPLAWALYAALALDGAVQDKGHAAALSAAMDTGASGVGDEDIAASENRCEAVVSAALAAAEAAVHAGIAQCDSAEAWTALRTVFEARGLWEVSA
jgi:hypothetical protein